MEDHESHGWMASHTEQSLNDRLRSVTMLDPERQTYVPQIRMVDRILLAVLQKPPLVQRQPTKLEPNDAILGVDGAGATESDHFLVVGRHHQTKAQCLRHHY